MCASKLSIQDFIRFLAEPASYTPAPSSVKIIQTHASVVALTDEFAYKLKKELNLGFLDFSTLAKRKFYCEEEMRLNARLSTGIYLEILPIYLNNKQLSFECLEGEIVNYVIKMRRLPEKGFLINLIHNPDFQGDSLKLLGQKLSFFYQNSASNPPIANWGLPEKIKISIVENFQQMLDFLSFSLSPLTYKVLKKYQYDYLENQKEKFLARVKAGKIIEGHGDLRSEHIHFQGDSVNIYDCLEFSERLRCLDYLNDLAFLAMDLEYRGRYDLSKSLINNILQKLNDTNALDLLNFYQCYRACVRGKVDSMKALEAEISPQIKAESLAKAQKYFKLALQYAVLGNQPLLIAVMGGVATGKSTLAQNISEAFDIQVLNSDVIRKELAHLPIFSRPSETVRKNLYSPEMTELVYQTLFSQAISIIQKNRVCIIDATFKNESDLKELKQNTENQGITLLILETQTPADIILQRLEARESQICVSDMRLSDYQPEKFDLQYNPAKIHSKYLKIDTSELKECNWEELFLKIQEILGQPSQNIRKATIFA
jgi:aminoglycoside phosphotransferase family enzyme/predicted kinase